MAVNKQSLEDAPELPNGSLCRPQLVVGAVVLPDVKVVVSCCHQLVVLVIEELAGECEVCMCRAAADGCATLHIPENLRAAHHDFSSRH